MNANAAASDDNPPPASLRGTNRGLEIVIADGAGVEEISEALVPQLEKSPSFFTGNDVTISCEGPLPCGCLGPLEEIATRFGLRIAAVNPPPPAPREPERAQSEPERGPETAPTPAETAAHEPAEVTAPEQASACQPRAALAPPSDATGSASLDPDAPRIVVGPVRSGVILEAAGDLVILGDVNPGAEVLAGGDIVVLGTLRGVAHAACRRERGFILALTLKPQQLRIGTLIARAADADSPAAGAEIAYANGRNIVVDGYRGRLPGGLAAARS